MHRYKCPKCGFKCFDSTMFKNHMRILHKKVYSDEIPIHLNDNLRDDGNLDDNLDDNSYINTDTFTGGGGDFGGGGASGDY